MRRARNSRVSDPQSRARQLQSIPAQAAQFVSAMLPEIAYAGYKFLVHMAAVHRVEGVSQLEELFPPASFSERYVSLSFKDLLYLR